MIMKAIDLKRVSRGTSLPISPNFHLSEFLVTSTGLSNDIIDSCIFGNLSALCHLVLEPVRAMIEEPIYITSGFRTFAVNKAVGGVADSYHLSGLACDIAISSDSFGDDLMYALSAQNGFLASVGLTLYYERHDDKHYIHVQLMNKYV